MESLSIMKTQLSIIDHSLKHVRECFFKLISWSNIIFIYIFRKITAFTQILYLHYARHIVYKQLNCLANVNTTSNQTFCSHGECSSILTMATNRMIKKCKLGNPNEHKMRTNMKCLKVE